MKLILTALALCLLATAAFAADASSLKLPAGTKVAVVMFEDLECPSCAYNYPVVLTTARAHNIPVVLHDFPLPKHAWSFEAAVDARFFDSKSETLGNDFRSFIFQNQDVIDPRSLRQYVQMFADANHVTLPFVLDPESKLKAAVEQDRALGQRIGIDSTPTIFVIGQSGKTTLFTEVQDSSKLAQAIEDMQKKISAH